MTAPATLDASVLIATYNRAHLLGETLDAFARMRVSSGLRWEVIVIDNNSHDDTRAAVEARQPGFPTDLVYLFEAQQGRSSALNTGIAAARGRLILFTDDDMRPFDGWLDVGCAALVDPDPSIGYASGPIRPIWGAPPPDWLDLTRGDLWGTIGIHDHGTLPFIYEERLKAPMPGNLAIRKSVLEAIGGFRPELGRTNSQVLLGQEGTDLLMRAHAIGIRGRYVPAMKIEHHIPADRLTRSYFRKWWYGRGVSRAILERRQPVTELGLDLRTVPHLLGVPVYMFKSAANHAIGWLVNRVRSKPAAAFRKQMMLMYFAGYVSTRLRERRLPYQSEEDGGEFVGAGRT
jgi:glucosyl-dolichyl phosphate glucuronosyltransferase